MLWICIYKNATRLTGYNRVSLSFSFSLSLVLTFYIYIYPLTWNVTLRFMNEIVWSSMIINTRLSIETKQNQTKIHFIWHKHNAQCSCSFLHTFFNYSHKSVGANVGYIPINQMCNFKCITGFVWKVCNVVHRAHDAQHTQFNWITIK